MSIDERTGSVAFEPAPLGPRRPSTAVALGVAVVVIGLAVAIVKPWDMRPVATASDQASATATPASSPAESQGPIGPEPATLPVSAEVAGAILPHDAWGVRTIVRSPAVEERWVAVGGGPDDGSAGDTGSVAVIGSRDEPIAALGVTSPRILTPLDVRIWRPTSDDGWAWLDVRPVAPALTGGDLLFWPPGQEGGRLGVWPAGRYRLEILLGSTVVHIDIAIPGRFERVPAELPAPTPPGELLPAEGFVPTALGAGSFLVADGAATSLAPTAGARLDASTAWLGATSIAELAGGSVASTWQPRATGLGILLPAGTWLARAELHRLAPGPFVIDPAPIVGQAPVADGSAPYALFAPPDAGAWAPGTYEIRASWVEGGQQRSGAWGIELRPAPDRAANTRLDAARGFARFAGSPTLDVGVDTRLPDAFGGTSCDDARSDPDPAALGISHPVSVPMIDVNARLRLSGGRSQVVPLRIVSEVVPGMTLVAPASGGTLPSGLYQLEMVEGTGLERRVVCLGSGPFEG